MRPSSDRPIDEFMAWQRERIKERFRRHAEVYAKRMQELDGERLIDVQCVGICRDNNMGPKRDPAA